MDLPQTFTEWKYCIEKTCGIPLDELFIQQRLSALNDNSDRHTLEFIKIYGQTYQAQVVYWFGEAQEQLLKQALS